MPLEHARADGRDGAHVVAVPRVTPSSSLETWLAGGRACAVVAGAWSLSSNSAEPEHGGLGWVVALTEATGSGDLPAGGCVSAQLLAGIALWCTPRATNTLT